MHYQSNTYDSRKRRSKIGVYKAGFSVYEMVVVIFIIVTLTAVSVASYRKYNNQSQFNNLVLDAALTVRSAQVYGISTTKQTSATTFHSGFGAYFDKTANSFVLYADTVSPGGLWYNGASENEGPVSSLRAGYIIHDICTTTGGTETCGFTELSVAFVRPDLNAHIKTASGGADASQGRVVFRSPTGETRSMIVTSTGQISHD